jgi:2,3-bisphosphoglycerate-independent phosphoglycerate mutase
MKYLLIIGDGMADNPVPALSGKTPLETANKPTIDGFAAQGVLGCVRNCPESLPPGSDTAILSIFGCNPLECYSGRAPLEAAAIGLILSPGDAAFRCNMVTLSEDAPFEDRLILSHSAGSIEGEESIDLVKWLFSQPDFAVLAEKARVSVCPTPSFRHIAVRKQADLTGIVLPPPHDHLNERVGDNLPHGCGDAELLLGLMKKSNELLDHCPANEKRRAEGKLPANSIWFWAEGTAAALPNFVKIFGYRGGVISAVPLVKGIGRLVGLDIVEVEGVNGEWDTNYEGKTQAALDVLKDCDFVAVHLEGPDEATHNGQLKEKIQAIEWLDSRVVAPLTAALRDRGENFRILILSDHKTLTTTRGHDGTPVPFLIYDSRVAEGSGLSYTEKNGETGPCLSAGTALMPALFEL